MQSVSRDEYNKETVIDVVVDEFGFLMSPEQWSESFAENVLGLMPGELTPAHLKVILYVRNRFSHLRALPPLRRVCQSTGLGKSEIKELFGSCIQLWRATGLPRPYDAILSHMN